MDGSEKNPGPALSRGFFLWILPSSIIVIAAAFLPSTALKVTILFLALTISSAVLAIMINKKFYAQVVRLDTEAKKAIDQYITIFSNIQDGILVQDSKLQYVFANQAVGEFLELGSNERVSQETIFKTLEQYKIEKEDGTSFSLDDLPGHKIFNGQQFPPSTVLRLIHKESQRETYLSFVGRGVLDERGEPVWAVSIIRNITRQKQDETEREFLLKRMKIAHSDAEQQRKRFYSLLMQAPVSILIVRGPNHTVELANPTFLDTFMNGQGIEKKAAREVFSEYSDLFSPLWNEILKTGIFKHQREVLVYTPSNKSKKESRYFNFLAQPLLDLEKKVEGIMTFAIEVTDQVQARMQMESVLQELSRHQMALKKNETELRLITDHLPALIAHLDAHRNFLFVNRNYELWLRRPRHEIYGRQIGEIQGDSYYQFILPYMDLAYQGEQIEFELTDLDQDGSTQYFRTAYIPDLDPVGNVRGIFVLTQDISQMKRTEIHLQEAVKARDEFLSIASHELKTPLTSLKLQTQIRLHSLKSEKSTPTPAPISPERFRKMLESDQRQIARLSRLIEDMLDISRINSGKLTVQRESVELCELVSEVVERFGPQLEAAGCTINIQQKPPIQGEWDRYRIEQVLINLLTNAMKYGAGKPISIQLTLLGDRAQIEVKDQGIGIAKEDQDRIFLQFERAVSGNEISGLGLGLYIVNQILIAHGGSIRVESEIGRGSNFVVELPLFPGQNGAHEQKTGDGS